jgi:queuine tRNA-ribosyltransferase
MSVPFSYRLITTSGMARLGEVITPRGVIRTPAFMPVGTAATVKAVYLDQVKAAGADIILGNTYHLMLRPTAERIHRLGGLHSFMRWDGPILTDSGGFQVMSLSKIRKMSEDGAQFQSHLDGSRHMLTPERSIEIQCLLGSDIQMQLDECVQGGTEPALRRRSAEALAALDLLGYSVGGLAVGEGQPAMLKVLEETLPYLPTTKPRYLMGVGTPQDLIESVAVGIDMFDCVLPTRSGRHGTVYTWNGKVNIKNAKHAEDLRPLDPTSTCAASTDYSRAYLNHLLKSGEYLGAMILSWANTAFYQELMRAMRLAIAEGRFASWREETLIRLAGNGEPVA